MWIYIFSMSRDLKNHVIEQICEWKILMVYNHLDKFDGQRYCTGRDMFLVCRVIKQDHVIKGQVTVKFGAPQGQSLECQVWWS